jgi:hypothetical protein
MTGPSREPVVHNASESRLILGSPILADNLVKATAPELPNASGNGTQPCLQGTPLIPSILPYSP